MCSKQTFIDYFRTRLQLVQQDLPEHQYALLNDAILTPDALREVIIDFVEADGESKELDWLYSLTNQFTVPTYLKLNTKLNCN